MERHDPLFTRLLEESRGIEGFFDNLFSFLSRRTDFLTRPEAAREQLLTKFDQYADLHKNSKPEVTKADGQQSDVSSQEKYLEVFKREQAALRREPKIVELADGDESCFLATPQNRASLNVEPETSSLATGDSNVVDDGMTPNSSNGYAKKQ